MTTDSDLQYVLDRFAIQDLIGKYGLGQDLHQAGRDQNVLEQWSEIFAPDAVVDASAVGGPEALSLLQYAELLRGPGLDGSAGMPAHFDAWQHREGYATVEINGDTATAISPFLHLHQARDGGSNLIHAGLWHDRLARLPQGWRITHRRLEDLFFNTFPRIENPAVI
jgi:SnoaL-like domain